MEPIMRIALELAARAGAAADVPVGAVVVVSATRTILGQGMNRKVRDKDPTAHAEVLALRQAGRTLRNWQLPGCTLVVSLEPCAMCVHAALEARVERIVYGAPRTRNGNQPGGSTAPLDVARAAGVDVQGGVLADEAATMLREWFAAHRAA